ncbi:uncharacterized protein LOC108734178 [Agrilus planipennis]|uniref:Uncharacterized protein LOC108734178 n=1 Tax=Agrilus planipennis TaxID=224129 RepID=A0A1W4WM38_AGRPL|nr:uncharacterized protein LOC108734178 [Agrilus planipennis]
MNEISKLEDILPEEIRKSNSLLSYTIEPLTSAGDNYGSEVQLITLQLQDKSTNRIKETKVVAKRAPESEFIKKLFNTPVTFRKEVKFYQEVLPALRRFQNENGVDDLLTFVPKYYGGRLTLQVHSEEADNDAIFLLENLKVSGFRNEDRLVGFDLETSIVILDCLAKLHGTVLAFKTKKPEEFQKIVMPALEYPFTEIPLNTEAMKKLLDDIINAGIAADSSLAKKSKEIYEKLMKSMKIRYSPPKPNEIFATMCHNDFWVNNIMVKRSGEGSFVQCKVLDFQITQYGSPAKDVFFFLMSSTKRSVKEDHFETLCRHYFNTLMEVLEMFSVDTTSFSYELFLEEIKTVVQEDEFYHLMVMLKPIFASRGEANELKDYDMNNLLSNDVESDLYREQVAYTINKLYARKWI